MTDNVSGEQVAYQYDELNRLMAAGSGWSQAYQYDGFGNMTQQGGYQATYDAATNRETNYYTSYDPNGNIRNWSAGTASYDTENRLIWHTNSGVERVFGYDPWGRRLWRSGPAAGQWEYYFYGVMGQKLADIQRVDDPKWCGVSSTLMYFGSRLVKENGQSVTPDRLGSVRRNGTGYYPYGEEQTPTDDGRVKFATYTRDLPGLDYADQRYYNASKGRFWTPDPSLDNVDYSNPLSWNAYAYVMGDPINFNDPDGLSCNDVALEGWAGIPAGTTVGQFLSQSSDLSVFAKTVFTEARVGWDDTAAYEKAAISAVIMNRWQIVNGYYDLYNGTVGARGTGLVRAVPDWGTANGSIGSIVHAPAHSSRSGLLRAC
jgi:RHS repeat-associated protein